VATWSTRVVDGLAADVADSASLAELGGRLRARGSFAWSYGDPADRDALHQLAGEVFDVLVEIEAARLLADAEADLDEASS
jgi:hypothetical protein